MDKILKAFFTMGCLVVLPCAAMAQGLEQPLRVLVVGDSVLAGVGLRAEEKFSSRLEETIRQSDMDATVVDLSEQEATTASVREKLSDIYGQAPDLVVLEVGENDMKRGLDAKMVQDNLYKIALDMRDKGVYVVVLGTKAPAAQGETYAKIIKHTFEEIANYCPVYPYALDGISGNQEMTVADGYHPNARGVDHILNSVYPLIETGLKWKTKILLDRQAQGQQQKSETAPSLLPQ